MINVGLRAAVSVGLDADLEDIYREHGERLWRAVLAYAGDPEVARDAVAEAFAQCLHRGVAVRDPPRWLWRAAFRIAAGELKERRRRTDRMESVTRLMHDEVDSNDSAGALMEALGRLSPRQRAALVLHYYGGYRTGEIARMVGSSPATVRVHLSQGRKRLRRLLEADDD